MSSTSRKGGDKAEVKKFALVDTSWGTCAVVWRIGPNVEVLCRILLPGLEPDDMRKVIRKEEGALEVPAAARDRPEWWGELTELLTGFFGKDPTKAMAAANGVWERWGKRLDLERLTDFQRAVLRSTAQIPAGQTATYGQLAQRVGRTGAARAVGGALGANPWPVLIPCHRVVGSGGAMRGFSAPGGCQAKRRMIDWERGSHL